MMEEKTFLGEVHELKVQDKNEEHEKHKGHIKEIVKTELGLLLPEKLTLGGFKEAEHEAFTWLAHRIHHHAETIEQRKTKLQTEHVQRMATIKKKAIDAIGRFDPQHVESYRKRIEEIEKHLTK